MKSTLKHCLALSLLAICLFCQASTIRPARIFSDNMILQRDKPIKIWGTAEQRQAFEIRFADITKKVRPDANGKWQVEFPPMKAGGPYRIEFKSDTTFCLNNILIGDVWICSGQSNMEWSMLKTYHSAYELAKADQPDIRYFPVPREKAETPCGDFSSGTWEMATKENVASASAVAYFFAKNLYASEKVPQGIICTNWGGTPIESWTSLESLAGHPDYREKIKAFKSRTGTPESFTALQRESAQEFSKWKKENESKDPGYTGRWYRPKLSTEDWKEMNVPGFWEYNGLPGYDGIVWLRKEIDLPPCMEGKPLVLNMEILKDFDTTWFNGVRIGSVNWNNGRRIYSIPASAVRKGKNTIVVRIENVSGNGGFTSVTESDIYIREMIGEQVVSIPLSGKWKYKPAMKITDCPAKPRDKANAATPSCLYNAMVAPITNLSVKGIIWYQGETNSGRAYQYQTLFPLMIQDWRKQFKQGDFPFLFVQLAGFGPISNVPQENAWAELREAQSMTLRLPNTGMTVAIDLGNPNDVHPINKQEVGRRLAIEAEKVAYGKPGLITSPVYRSMQTTGNKIVISFSNAENGLLSTNEKIGGFAIADKSKNFVWAKAEIRNDKVIIWNDSIAEPVAVRYAWTGSPVEGNGANLYNKEGFPVSPFRTDQWTPITFKNK